MRRLGRSTDLRPNRLRFAGRYVRKSQPLAVPVSATFNPATMTVEVAFSQPVTGADQPAAWTVCIEAGGGEVDQYGGLHIALSIAGGHVRLALSGLPLTLPGGSGVSYAGTDASFRDGLGRRVAAFAFNPVEVGIT